MSRPRGEMPVPPCYAMVLPGLEEAAAEEIERDLGGEVRKKTRGLVVFRLDPIDDRLLTLRTTEDVFLFAWGSDQLSYRAVDLERIQRWTAREPDWADLLRRHHAVRILDQAVPFGAIGALAGPAVAHRPAGLADIAFLRLRHGVDSSGT